MLQGVPCRSVSHIMCFSAGAVVRRCFYISKLSEKRKEIEDLNRRVSWFEKYVDKETETLRSYYDELEQVE